MKAAGNLLIGILLGGVIGWFLGFLRLPDIEKFPSFILGFIACLLLVLLALTFLFIRLKHVDLLRLLGKSAANADTTKATKTYHFIWILAAVFIVAGSLLSSFLIYRQGNYFKAQMQQQNRKIKEQSVLIESARKGNLVFLMSNILDNAEAELKNAGTLSDALIARIAALSFSFKPYSYLEGDSLSDKEFSPERGQLLMALLLMKMDSASFIKIKQRAVFSGADLRGADLIHADLSGAKLNNANLNGTNLSNANLKGADLKDANLWGANLNKANLSGADLKRSDLRWAELNEADLQFAKMDGAQLSGAQVLKADARELTAQYADLGGTLFHEANLAGANFLGAKMSKVNFSQADLTRADLRMTDLNEANLSGTKLNKALVDSNWMEKLSEWKLTGGQNIQDSFRIVTDSLDQWNHAVYHLKKVDEPAINPAK